MGPIALVIHTKRIAGGGGGWGKGWVHYFVFLPHTCHICSVQLRVAMTPPTERELACSLPSPPLPFVSVGSPTVMWGSYRLFIAVGFVFFFGPHGASVIFLSAARKRGQTCVKTVQCISAPRSTCTQINHLSSAVGGIGLLSSLQFAVAFNFHIPQRFLWDCTH